MIADKKYIADLHMHTTRSDGTDSPSEIYEAVKTAGVNIFSVTDHDAISACSDIRKIIGEDHPERVVKKPGCVTAGDGLAEDFLAFINGVEFSCKDEGGKYHILVYGYDLDAPAINGVVNKAHGIRMKKLDFRLDFLRKDFGIDFSKEEIDKLKGLSNPGKPHIAKLMIKKGYAKNTQEAMHEYINKKRPKDMYIRPEEAIEAALKSGGIPVLAHAPFGDGDQLIVGDELDERIRHLLAFGLKGIEAYYSGYSPKLNLQMLELAEKYDLLCTAGSDYHGSNKIVRLKDNGLEDISHGGEGLIRFLKQIFGW